MCKNIDSDDQAFFDWYAEVISHCIAELGFHPEAVPVAGYWRDWHRGGHTPQTAVEQFSLLLLAA